MALDTRGDSDVQYVVSMLRLNICRFSPRRSVMLVAVTAILAVSCGEASNSTETLPGSGIMVTMARANWSTGYFQAEIYRQLAGELGYTVSAPGDLELDPASFYVELATGNIDFWANGWFPSHQPFLDEELGDGSVIGDHVVPLGIELAGGGLQGIMIDSATAETFSISWLGDIGGSPEIAALFDTDGDGSANLAGCNEGWGCQLLLNELIADNGWSDTIEQDSGVYDDLWTAMITRMNDGQPVLAYTWTPSAYIAEMTPGENSVWMSMAQADGSGGGVSLSPKECPGQPCDLGFAVSDIQVVVNREFLAANPELGRLFEFIGFQLSDIVVQNYQMKLGEDLPADIERQAGEWIERERRTVDAWLREARNVGN
jgi:glycine betaine/proline transport system substrate-binding protein